MFRDPEKLTRYGGGVVAQFFRHSVEGGVVAEFFPLTQTDL